jgi:uncharacterized caspase-like protein
MISCNSPATNISLSPAARRRRFNCYTLLLVAIFLWVPGGSLAAGGELREEFHESYPLSLGGRVSVSNSLGEVRIRAWDRPEVRVDAVKRAYRPERLAEAQIEVSAGTNSITIRTLYPGGAAMFQTGNPDSSAIVDYTLTVPRATAVEASSQSGGVTALGLSGYVKISSMSGDVEATFDQVTSQGRIELKTMSGSVSVTLPSDASADVSASSMSGRVRSDFQLAANQAEDDDKMSTRIGGGGPSINLSSMSGDIHIRRGPPSRTPTYVAEDSEAAFPAPTPTPPDRTPPRIQIIYPRVERGVGVSVGEKSVSVVGRATDESGVSEVLVSGSPARIDRDGNFSAEVRLGSGRNRIVVTATDTRGNRAVEEFIVSSPEAEASSPITPPGTIPHGGPGLVPAETLSRRYYAIVIGNNNYQFHERLKTAVNDAEAVAKTLQDDFGFETTLLRDATRDQILKTFNEYRRKLDDNSSLLIYYAGHGIYDRDADKAYWLPVDARADENVKWVSADDVTTNIRAIPARQVLVVSDSCYSGLITGGGDTRAARISLAASERERYIQKMLAGRSRLLMTSGGNEPVLDGGGQGHSVFANAFLNGLRQMEQSVFTAEELFYTYIRESVAGKSDQTPQYNPIRNSGHDSGDFIFVRRR